MPPIRSHRAGTLIQVGPPQDVIEAAATTAAAQAVTDEIAGRSLLEGPARYNPSVIIAADGSEDANGSVSPTLYGSPSVVTGTYGDAWRFSASGQYGTVTNNGYLDRNAGAVIVRFSSSVSLTNGQFQDLFSTTSEGFRIRIRRLTTSTLTNAVTFSIGSPMVNLNTATNVVPANTLHTLALAWDNGTAEAWVNGVSVGTIVHTVGTANPASTYITLASGTYPFDIESQLIYDERAPDDEIERISALAAAHTIDTAWYDDAVTLPVRSMTLGTGGPTLGVTTTGNLTVNGDVVATTHGQPLLSVDRAGNNTTITNTLDGKALIMHATRDGYYTGGVYNPMWTDYDGTRIHTMSDDAAPVHTFTTVGGNHGYTTISVYTVAGHSKTTADLGSTYTDGTRTYTLLAIAGNNLTFGHPYTVADGVTTGVSTSPAATLTHVANGTDTANVPITSKVSGAQLYPSVNNHTVTYWMDGAEVTGDGTFTGSRFEVRDTYHIMDYKALIDWAQANVGQSYANDDVEGVLRVSTTWRYLPEGRCLVSGGLTALKKVWMNDAFGLIHTYKLGATGHTLYRYMPDVAAKSGYDFAVPVDMTAYATTIIYGPSDLLDPAIAPSRSVDWLYSGGTPVVGHTIGYITDKTNSKHADRVTSPEIWDMRSTGKVYPRLMDSVMLEVGDHKNFEAFRNYLAPHPSGATLVNVVEDEAATYVHLDFHTSVTAEPIPLPDHIGKSVTVLQSDGLTVANDTVDAAGLTVNVPGSAGRAVVKLT